MSVITHNLSSELEDVVDTILRRQLKMYLEHSKGSKLSTASGLSDFLKHLEDIYNLPLNSVGLG